MKRTLTPEEYISKCRSLLQQGKLDINQYGVALRSLIDQIGPFRRAALWRPILWHRIGGR